MAKSITQTGSDRFNLMLALTGYLIQNRRVKLDDLAKHFDVRPKEITSALVTISLSGVGAYLPNELFFLDYDLLEEGIIDISFSPVIDDVPRLSVRQASAIAAGLTYLSSIVADEEKLEIIELLKILSQGTVQKGHFPISVLAMPLDVDIDVIRSAITTGKRISCMYRNNRGEISLREIDPLVLESSDTTWYLRGYCLAHEEVRAFRIDRLRDAKMLDIDISVTARNSEITNAIYTVSQTDTEVKVELEQQALGFIWDFNPENPPVQLPSGNFEVSVKIGHLPNLGKIVSKYGGAARVISPESAKQVVRDYARNALGLETQKPKVVEE
jgi:proteasome accessory factor C